MESRLSKSVKGELVAAEASQWFIEFRTGEMSLADRSRFYEWLRRSPEHIQAYLEIAEGWAELPTSDPGHRIDIQHLIARARDSRDENVVPLSLQATAAPRRTSTLRMAVAACVAGVALILGAVVWGFLYRANTYSTGIGEQRTVRLQDGSTIELNALSSVRVRLSSGAREVDLRDGQALFRVAKDPDRPFLVHSGATTVRAVGTEFDVYRKRSGTIVTVVEGRVAVAEVGDRPQLVYLAAGDQVVVPPQPKVQQSPPKHADVAVATAWVQKRLIFEGTPLAEVADEYNRYNTRRLVIVGAELRSIGISGIYSSTDPDSLLGFLRAQPNIVLTESDHEIEVRLRDRN
ncbi:MAG: FecR domain-containing protein [Proteobacteria bacterium]|nr:FecR domain-containing protein [Pseudomonadota bacterium]